MTPKPGTPPRTLESRVEDALHAALETLEQWQAEGGPSGSRGMAAYEVRELSVALAKLRGPRHHRLFEPTAP